MCDLVRQKLSALNTHWLQTLHCVLAGYKINNYYVTNPLLTTARYQTITPKHQCLSKNNVHNTPNYLREAAVQVEHRHFLINPHYQIDCIIAFRKEGENDGPSGFSVLLSETITYLIHNTREYKFVLHSLKQIRELNKILHTTCEREKKNNPIEKLCRVSERASCFGLYWKQYVIF